MFENMDLIERRELREQDLEQVAAGKEPNQSGPGRGGPGRPTSGRGSSGHDHSGRGSH
jgi:hypothetical protein